MSQGGNRSEKEERRRVVPKGGWELQGKVADVSVGLGRLFRAWLESLGFVDVGLHMRVNGRLIAPYGCSLSPRARGHRSADLIDAQRSLTSEVDEENVERENRKRNRPAAAQIGRVCYYGPLCTSYSLERANGKIVTKASSHRITDTQKIVCNIVRLYVRHATITPSPKPPASLAPTPSLHQHHPVHYKAAIRDSEI